MDVQYNPYIKQNILYGFSVYPFVPPVVPYEEGSNEVIQDYFDCISCGYYAHITQRFTGDKTYKLAFHPMELKHPIQPEFLLAALTGPQTENKLLMTVLESNGFERIYGPYINLNDSLHNPISLFYKKIRHKKYPKLNKYLPGGDAAELTF